MMHLQPEFINLLYIVYRSVTVKGEFLLQHLPVATPSAQTFPCIPEHLKHLSQTRLWSSGAFLPDYLHLISTSSAMSALRSGHQGGQ